MARRRLTTFFPDLPGRNVPRVRSYIARSTFCAAFRPSLATSARHTRQLSKSHAPGRELARFVIPHLFRIGDWRPRGRRGQISRLAGDTLSG